jgi:YfiH family protein
MGLIPVSQGSEVPFFKFSAFGGSNVRHGFFGRRGGVSTGIFSGLNCGPGSGDNPGHIVENRARVATAMGVAAQNLLSLYQVHGVECIAAPASGDDRPKADALVTDKPGLALSILTADCVPVLFYGRKGNGDSVIGAAHAGWKGAIGGVLDSTVDKMISEYGANLNTIQAAIGPAIQKKSYEVDSAFQENFLKSDLENERFFQNARKSGHAMFDLPGYCAARIAARGIRDVFVNESDTYTNEADFYSYRRTAHRGEPDYGRQISVVVIGGR